MKQLNFLKRILLLLLLIPMIMLSVACSADSPTNKATVSVVNSESFFSNFTVDNDQVYIKCHITLQNTEDEEQRVKMAAVCPDDVENGLLKSEKIYAVNKHDEVKEFVIEPNSTKSFNVVFLGEFAGTAEKSNRLLPEIIIENVS